MIRFILLNIIGSTLYALGIQAFTAPQHIAPGGASGIAIIVRYLTDFPMGQFTFLFNIPLLIMSYKNLSKKFVWNALISIILFSLITDYVVVWFPIYKGDMLLASVFGGVLMGVGLGVVHISESTTGGLSILGLLLQKKYPQFEVGKMLFVLNFLVVLASVFVFKNVESMLYAVITIFVSSKCMDSVVYGWNNNKFLVIISDENEKIKENILASTNRGVTILDGRGGYSEHTKQVIFCAVEKNGFIEVRKMIQAMDPNAFVIVTDTSEIIGKEFKSIV